MWKRIKIASGFRQAVTPPIINRLKYFNIINVLLLSVFCSSANAAIISMNTTNTNLNIGDSFVVDFIISDLTSNTGDSLSAFDFDILFDNTVLSYNGASFTNTGSDNQLELAESGAWPFDGDVFDLGSGLLDAYGISGNSDSVLDTSQLNEFRFLGLEFTAIAASTSASISINLNDPFLLLLDSGFNDLSVSYSPSSVDVSIASTNQPPTNIPEPGTLLLFAAGIPIFSAGVRKYRKNKGEN